MLPPHLRISWAQAFRTSSHRTFLGGAACLPSTTYIAMQLEPIFLLYQLILFARQTSTLLKLSWDVQKTSTRMVHNFPNWGSPQGRRDSSIKESGPLFLLLITCHITDILIVCNNYVKPRISCIEQLWKPEDEKSGNFSRDLLNSHLLDNFAQRQLSPVSQRETGHFKTGYFVKP